MAWEADLQAVYDGARGLPEGVGAGPRARIRLAVIFCKARVMRMPEAAREEAGVLCASLIRLGVREWDIAEYLGWER